jgi:hypothetical protein
MTGAGSPVPNRLHSAPGRVKGMRLWQGQRAVVKVS